MWTICLQSTEDVAPGTEELVGNEEACRNWLKDNQVFYDEDTPNPLNNETFGSKYVLLDLQERNPVIDVDEPNK